MEQYEGILCITGSELIRDDRNPEGLMAKGTADSMVARGQLNRLRRASQGSPALYEYASLPLKYRRAWEEQHGDPTRQPIKAKLIDFIHFDDQAREYYADLVLPSGELLISADASAANRYTINASVLNGIGDYIDAKLTARRMNGVRTTKKMLWDSIAAAIDDRAFRQEWSHNLPIFPAKLRAKFEEYKEKGYTVLVHAGFGNSNSQKRNCMTERIVRALHTMPNRPFNAQTHELYMMFATGKIDLVDKETGELFDRKWAQDKTGQPLKLAASTIANIINQPATKAALAKRRVDAMYYTDKYMPHAHRNTNIMSFSKLTADDRDLPRLDQNGERPKAYYVYDVGSTAVVGMAYSRKKDDALFIECLRDMYRNIYREGFPMPAEVEVENHIVNHFREEIESMFTFVRWCRPGNSIEKYAERLNKDKKYSVEHKNHANVGRWWARSEAYKSKTTKCDDKYIERRWDYDQLVAEDRYDCWEYNNSLHPNQKKYPGMTRFDVLKHNMNPNLGQPSKPQIAWCIGDRIRTTIRRNQYFKANNQTFALPSPEVLRRLAPGDYRITACVLPNNDGVATEAYVFQDGNYICTSAVMELYNTAAIERTADDERIMEEQFSYISRFKSQVREDLEQTPKVAIIENEKRIRLEQEVEAEEFEVPAVLPLAQLSHNDEFDLAAAERQALNNLKKISYEQNI